VWPLGINTKSSGGQATVMTSGQHNGCGQDERNAARKTVHTRQNQAKFRFAFRWK
jgi:hypothetical protein